MAQQLASEKKENDSASQSKFVVISGITSGIGEGLLHSLIKRNHKVAGFGRNKDKIEELRKQYKLSSNEKDLILFSSFDILDSKKLNEWCDTIVETHGIPDILINNVGSTVGGNKPVWELDISKVEESFNTHLIGSILLIKGFVPKMREKSGNDNKYNGIIINISSWASTNGVAELSPYVMSKHGIEGLTKCLAKELSELNPNMAAISVSPGWVLTGMLEGSYEAIYGKQIGLENGIEWAEKCCDWLLKLNCKHNGMSLGPSLEKESMKKYCDFVTMCGIDAKFNDYIHPTGFENENENNENANQSTTNKNEIESNTDTEMDDTNANTQDKETTSKKTNVPMECID